MKIFVTGTRGIPNIPGGVEKHCEELFPRVVSLGHEVFLCTRSSYVTGTTNEWKGVKLVKCFAPRNKSLEAIVHTFITLLKSRLICPDVVHIHGIGPSLLAPLARLMGLRVVVTNHGPDYDRQKWGRLAKFVLRLGEKVGGLFANEVIVISRAIADIVHTRCRREPSIVPNGVTLLESCRQSSLLTKIGAAPGKYILAVARFVPEKGIHDLIEAFQSMKWDYKLLIAGDADHESDYSRRLREMAARDPRTILTGYITGDLLRQVYTHASLFVLPSYHEGLPIALLEALSCGVPVLVSDIPANKEVGLPPERYFRCGDVDDLELKLQKLLDKGLSKEDQQEIYYVLKNKYDWDNIAIQTIKVYEKAIT